MQFDSFERFDKIYQTAYIDYYTDRELFNPFSALGPENDKMT